MPRPNGTIRAKVGVETKHCLWCDCEKDVIEFQPYWYQPKRCGKPYGDPVRRRLNKCKDCTEEVGKKKRISGGSEI